MLGVSPGIVKVVVVSSSDLTVFYSRQMQGSNGSGKVVDIKAVCRKLSGQVLAAQLEAGPVRLDAAHEDGGFSVQCSYLLLITFNILIS